MGLIVSDLPELPESSYNRFFITYKKCYDDNYHYILTFINNDFSGEVEEDFSVISSFGSNWVLINNEWCSTSLKIYSSYRNFYATDIVYSNYDMYTVSGDFYYSKSNYDYFDVSFVGGVVSSSSIVTTLKDPFLNLLPIIIIAVVGYIAFRKAWNFIKGGVKGA